MRGSTRRFKHYSGYFGGKRVYTIHTLAIVDNDQNATMGINFGNQLGINRPDLSRFAALEPRAGFGPATITLPR